MFLLPSFSLVMVSSADNYERGCRRKYTDESGIQAMDSLTTTVSPANT